MVGKERSDVDDEKVEKVKGGNVQPAPRKSDEGCEARHPSMSDCLA